VAAGLCAVAPLVAAAGPVEELQAKGQAFAKDGRFTDAIDAFEQADRIEPRAANACLIALADMRRELWPQAEMFLELCHDRADAQDPLPEWTAAADQQIAQRLSEANVALVEIHVTPDVPVHMTVSSFALDEALTLRTLHLPFGDNVIIATAPGYETVHQEVHVADRTPKTVEIVLHKAESKPVPRQATKAVPAATADVHAGKLPWLISGAGGALVIGGVITDLAWMQPLRTDLKNAMTTDEYAKHSSSFDTAREVTYALYGLGAAGVVAGVVLRYTVFKDTPEQMHVMADTVRGGAVVQFAWSPTWWR
jgi:tetratricopeptide (TPR) repeat protein